MGVMNPTTFASPLVSLVSALAVVFPAFSQTTQEGRSTPTSSAQGELTQPIFSHRTAIDFTPGTTDEEKAALRELLQEPAPSGGYHFDLHSRWPGAMGDPIELTWSLVPDGTGGSSLFSLLDSQFEMAGFSDPRAAWTQVIEDSFARWDELTGIRFTRIVVSDDADNGNLWGTPGSPGESGDIRIRAISIPGNILGTGVYPDASFEAGEISLNTNYYWPDPFPGFVYIFENTVMHEIGHAIGIGHVCPVEYTKLMEPEAGAWFYGPQHDDVRAAHALYGDYLEPNDTLAEAPYVSLPTLINGFDLSDIEESNGPFGPGALSSGRLSIDVPGDVDIFEFQWSEPVGMQVAIDNVGLLYADNPEACGPDQDECCIGSFTNSETIASLWVEILDRTGQVLDGGWGGATQELSVVNAPYYVRVTSTTPSFFEPQAYKLIFNISPGIPCSSPQINCDDGNPSNGTESCGPNGGCIVTYQADCNNNYVEDAFDIMSGSSSDCDADGIPDECQADCNGNGISDSCDIASGLSSDLDGDGVPDECQDDCNGNGIPDESELSASTDENDNCVLDECETTRFVPYSSDVPFSYNTLADALLVSNPGDTIRLATGTYTGPGFRNLELLNRTVQIIGAGAFRTTIELEQAGRFAVLAQTNGVNKTRIEGLRIRGGRVDDSDGVSPAGGALWIYGADVKIERCIFERNISTWLGGAIHIEKGVYSQRIRDCMFYDNVASFGGGIAAWDEEYPQIMNCTFADNHASGGGAAIGMIFGAYIESCIIRANDTSGGDQILVGDLGNAIVRYSNLPNGELTAWQGGPHVGNIATSARFVDRPANNYHIRGNSPCRNTGNPLLYGLLDIDGGRRLLEGRIDMGVDEYAPTQPTGPTIRGL